MAKWSVEFIDDQGCATREPVECALAHNAPKVATRQLQTRLGPESYAKILAAPRVVVSRVPD